MSRRGKCAQILSEESHSPRRGDRFPSVHRVDYSIDELPARFLRGASEVVVMQPVHHSHLVNLPVGLDFSRFR